MGQHTERQLHKYNFKEPVFPFPVVKWFMTKGNLGGPNTTQPVKDTRLLQYSDNSQMYFFFHFYV